MLSGKQYDNISMVKYRLTAWHEYAVAMMRVAIPGPEETAFKNQAVNYRELITFLESVLDEDKEKTP